MKMFPMIIVLITIYSCENAEVNTGTQNSKESQKDSESVTLNDSNETEDCTEAILVDFINLKEYLSSLEIAKTKNKHIALQKFKNKYPAPNCYYKDLQGNLTLLNAEKLKEETQQYFNKDDSNFGESVEVPINLPSPLCYSLRQTIDKYHNPTASSINQFLNCFKDSSVPKYETDPSGWPILSSMIHTFFVDYDPSMMYKIEVLLKHGFDPNIASNNSKSPVDTILHWSRHGTYKADDDDVENVLATSHLLELLFKYGLDSRSEASRRGFFTAAYNNNFTLMKIFLVNGVEVDSVLTEKDFTADEVYTSSDYYSDVIDSYKEYNSAGIHVIGKTVEELAIDRGDNDLIEFIQNYSINRHVRF